LTLSATSALVASASPVVTVAIAWMTLLLIAVAMIGMSTHRLIVLLLLLLLLAAGGTVADRWILRGSCTGIRI
jgi:hypothetical protein